MNPRLPGLVSWPLRVRLAMQRVNVSVVFSALALAASGFTLYRNFLYERFDIKLSVVDYRIDAARRRMLFELAVANSGNREVLLTDVDSLYWQSVASAHAAWEFDGGFSSDRLDSAAKFSPIVLRPLEVKLISLEATYDHEDLWNYGRVFIEELNAEAIATVAIGLSTDLLTPRSSRHRCQYPISYVQVSATDVLVQDFRVNAVMKISDGNETSSASRCSQVPSPAEATARKREVFPSGYIKETTAR